MRNIPIPVDSAALTFICVAAPRPRLVNQETGEVKTDRNGQTMYEVGLTATNQHGRADLVNVSVAGEPAVTLGQIVKVHSLLAYVWEQERNGRTRWGIAYRASEIVPVANAAAAA
jgi:hypothetical protein